MVKGRSIEQPMNVKITGM
ncbi:hypothetical protein C5167_002309 [Papaver somniferum]|uniref:Uncharacterized protein n=1 Tax=Papaver somniferum TaxID=3469 RepID=A0A4Y7L1K4_PAPSO|nr:hypothetical protein C5167_002309 [Papaver somniferum]